MHQRICLWQLLGLSLVALAAPIPAAAQRVLRCTDSLGSPIESALLLEDSARVVGTTSPAGLASYSPRPGSTYRLYRLGYRSQALPPTANAPDTLIVVLLEDAPVLAPVVIEATTQLGAFGFLPKAAKKTFYPHYQGNFEYTYRVPLPTGVVGRRLTGAAIAGVYHGLPTSGAQTFPLRLGISATPFDLGKGIVYELVMRPSHEEEVIYFDLTPLGLTVTPELYVSIETNGNLAQHHDRDDVTSPPVGFTLAHGEFPFRAEVYFRHVGKGGRRFSDKRNYFPFVILGVE